MAEQTYRTDEETKQQLRALRTMSNRGEVQAAIDRLNELQARLPEDAAIGFERASIIGFYSNPRDALISAREFAKRFPGNRGGPRLIAEALVKAGRYEEALKEVARAEEMGGPSQKTRALRVRILLLQGKLKEADALSKFDSELPDPGADTLWARAKASPPSDEAALDELITRLRRADAPPERIAGYKAFWYSTRGDVAKSLELFHRALAEFPDYEYLHISLARLEFKIGDRDAAINRLTRAFERNPINVQIAKTLIRTHAKRYRFLNVLVITLIHIKAQLRMK